MNTQLAQEYLDQLIEVARNKFNIPAIAITIMNSDSIYLQIIRGTRVHKTDNPATHKDLFHIGSCSKLVLAIIAGKMVEAEKIKWDTKFFEIYPELKKTDQGRIS